MEINNFNIDTLVHMEDPMKLIPWCQLMGLMTDHYLCPACGKEMRLAKTLRSDDMHRWRCSRRNDHDIIRSIRKGSWFEKSHLRVYEILKICYFWCLNLPLVSIAKELRSIQKATIGEWAFLCREVCAEDLFDTHEMIGGEGQIVEIDESQIIKEKILGRRVLGKWVLAGVQRKSNKCFFQIVEDRSSKTMLDVISAHVLPGTTIITESWKSYLPNRKEEFHHLSENPTYNFVDSKGLHSNKFGETWAAIKRQLPLKASKTNFDSYLYSYMWKRRQKDSPHHIFIDFIAAVKKSFPPATKD